MPRVKMAWVAGPRGWAAVVVAALAFWAGPAAALDGLPGPVREALKRHRLPAETLSVWAQDVAAEAPLVSHRPDVARNPASTIKLLTTLVALEQLGPTHRWTTDVHVTGPVRNGRLDGDLVLVGSGDPFLVVEHLWRLLATVRARGIETVAGRLVIDNTRFSVADEPPPAAFDGKPYRAYNATPDAFLVNFNSVDIVVERAQDGVRVRTDPPVAGLTLRSRLERPGGGCARRVLRYKVSGPLEVVSPPDAPLPTITVSGRFPRGCRRWSFARSLLPPVRFADGVVRALWTQMGGRIEGGLGLGPVPRGATRWYRHRSVPLVDVVRGINKFSNNVMARNLLLTLGAERFGPPGTARTGGQAVRAWLEGRGIDAPDFRIVNGSGLARETRISARTLGRVLLAGERSRFRPEFAGSLPLAALDGTMRKRLARDSRASRVRIKTGMLDGVRAMAGYVRKPGGRTVAVVSLQEHPKAHLGGRGTAVQDALLRWLLDRE